MPLPARSPRPRLARAVAAGLATALAAALGGCGGSTVASSAPVLEVVTGVYTLAQVAAEVGGANARVVDVYPPGTNPLTSALTATERARVAKAAVVVEVGGGFQPALEAAASAGRVVAMTPALGRAADGPWLDPRLVARFARSLQAAFSAADPAAAGVFANGARDVEAEMSSLAADFQVSLSDCSRHVAVTADGSFAAMARSFGFTDTPLGDPVDNPGPAQVAAAAALARRSEATTVFAEPWVPDGTATAAATAAGVKLARLDTLVGVPAGGWPKGATYPRLMENDLARLTGALQCTQAGFG